MYIAQPAMGRTASQRLEDALGHRQQRPVVLAQDGRGWQEQGRVGIHLGQWHGLDVLHLAVLPHHGLGLQGLLGLGSCLVQAVGLGSDVGERILYQVGCQVDVQ